MTYHLPAPIQTLLVESEKVEKIDPSRIFPSRFADRHADSFESHKFRKLVKLMDGVGNISPIVIRPLVSLPYYSPPTNAVAPYFEIVYGHRRHQACIELKVPVNAIVRDIPDIDLVRQMDRENKGRSDLGPWEKGRSFKLAMEHLNLPTAKDLARLLNHSKSQVSRCLAIANLPDELMIVVSPTQLKVRNGMRLVQLFECHREIMFSRLNKLRLEHQLNQRKTIGQVIAELADGLVAANPDDSKQSKSGVIISTINGYVEAKFTFFIKPKEKKELKAMLRLFCDGCVEGPLGIELIDASDLSSPIDSFETDENSTTVRPIVRGWTEKYIDPDIPF